MLLNELGLMYAHDSKPLIKGESWSLDTVFLQFFFGTKFSFLTLSDYDCSLIFGGPRGGGNEENVLKSVGIIPWGGGGTPQSATCFLIPLFIFRPKYVIINTHFQT